MRHTLGTTKHNTCAGCGCNIDKSDLGEYHATVIISRHNVILPDNQTIKMRNGEERGYKEIPGQLMTFCSSCYVKHLMMLLSDITIEERIAQDTRKADHKEHAKRMKVLNTEYAKTRQVSA